VSGVRRSERDRERGVRGCGERPKDTDTRTQNAGSLTRGKAFVPEILDSDTVCLADDGLQLPSSLSGALVVHSHCVHSALGQGVVVLLREVQVLEPQGGVGLFLPGNLRDEGEGRQQ
jgi:hypothetical protein